MDRVFISASGNGSQCAVIHPSCSLLQSDWNLVQVEAVDWGVLPVPKIKKHVKFTRRGIAFHSGPRSCPYMIDGGGVRTCNERFFSLYIDDITMGPYMAGSRFGEQYMDEAREIGNRATLTVNDETRSVSWLVNNVIIKRTYNGIVSVVSGDFEVTIHLVGRKEGDIKLKNGNLYTTMSFNRGGHVYTRVKSMRFHYDGYLLQARNRGYSASVKRENELVIY